MTSVLVIEPSEPERTRLVGELAAGGLDAHACDATDPASAAAAAAALRPALVLARWDFPGGGGLELLRRLDPGAADGWIPVILHGVGMTAGDRIAALDLGALDAMPATPAAPELIARVRAGLRLRDRMDLLERRAYRDALTGLINRGAAEDLLRRHREAARRLGSPLAILLIDLDRLKAINDEHGHHAGDDALRRVAAALARSVRSTDVVARYGGDEFLIIAPDCTPASAACLAARFRAALANDNPPAAIPPTLSVGIAGLDGPDPVALDDLIRRADRALYLAKHSGRDAVALHEPSSDRPILVPPTLPC